MFLLWSSYREEVTIEVYTFGSYLVFYNFGSYLAGNRHVKAIEDIEEQNE